MPSKSKTSNLPPLRGIFLSVFCLHNRVPATAAAISRSQPIGVQYFDLVIGLILTDLRFHISRIAEYRDSSKAKSSGDIRSVRQTTYH